VAAFTKYNFFVDEIAIGGHQLTVFTATAAGIGPFRYAISYNSSATNKVVGYYDYGSSITLADTETFTVDFDPTNGMIQLTMTP
jgi:hypothetical protein